MKDRVIFKVGEFTDFSGKTRQVIFCAVSTKVYSSGYDDNYNSYETTKSLYLGVSVQNPNDSVADPILGMKIAEGKARKEKSRVGTLLSTSKGMINTKVVEALLEQELEYFKQNPGVYIKGYNRDKELFLKSPELYYKKFDWLQKDEVE